MGDIVIRRTLGDLTFDLFALDDRPPGLVCGAASILKEAVQPVRWNATGISEEGTIEILIT